MTEEAKLTAVAQRQANPVQRFVDAMGAPQMQKRIASVLPKHLTPERMIKIAVSAISRNPLLLQCTTESVMKSVIIASELGLELNGTLGHAYLVPFKNNKKNPDGTWTTTYEAQFIPGYKGMVELARRSGFVLGVQARAVYENDKFSYEYGLHPKLAHTPCDSGDPGKLVRVYAVAYYKDDYSEFTVLNLPEVERHRARSKAKDSGPWVTDYEAMALKTAVRVLMKLSPQSPELARAIEVEERGERGEVGLSDLGFASQLDNLDDAQYTEVPKTRTDELREKVAATSNGNGSTTGSGKADVLLEIKSYAQAFHAKFGEKRTERASYELWTGTPGADERYLVDVLTLDGLAAVLRNAAEDAQSNGVKIAD